MISTHWQVLDEMSIQGYILIKFYKIKFWEVRWNTLATVNDRSEYEIKAFVEMKMTIIRCPVSLIT